MTRRNYHQIVMPKVKIFFHIFIWLLVILSFIIISGFLILRASGYYINFKAKILEKTGLIHLVSEPAKADVFLNGKYKGKTPLALTYLRPNIYEIQIKKEGYKNWKKSFKVETGLAQREKKIILFLEKPEIKETKEPLPQKKLKTQEEIKKTLLDEDILLALSSLPLKEGQFFPTSSGNPLAILDKNEDLWILKKLNRNLEIEKLGKKVKEVVWAEDSSKLLYRTSDEIWLYFVSKKEAKDLGFDDQNEIVTRFSKPIKKIKFYPTLLHILFLKENKLEVIEIQGTNETELLDLSSEDFWVSENGQEIFFKENGEIKKARIK